MRKFLIGVLVGCLLMMTTPVLADSILQSINVVMDSVEVQVNGEKLDVNTILYNGSTYLPMRKVAEAVGKDVEWNSDTMTANIVSKGDIMEEVIVYEEDGYKHLNIGDKLYHENGFVFDIIKQHENYSWYGYGDGENLKIMLVKNLEDGTEEVLIEYVPYYLYKDRIYISDLYLGESILPLLK
mgnify:CR=1 FL=1